MCNTVTQSDRHDAALIRERITQLRAQLRRAIEAHDEADINLIENEIADLTKALGELGK